MFFFFKKIKIELIIIDLLQKYLKFLPTIKFFIKKVVLKVVSAYIKNTY